MKTFLLWAGLCVSVILTCISNTFSQTISSPWPAAYATGGSGKSGNEICWLTWGTNGASVSNGTYYWSLAPGVTISATVSGLTSTNNVASPLQAYNSGNYSEDGLQKLYSGVNPIGLINKGDGDKVSFNIAVQLTINGTSITYPGLVVGDAESMATGESISATTPGSGWQLLDLRNNTNIFTFLDYTMNVSNSKKTFSFYDNVFSNVDMQGVAYSAGVSSLSNVTVEGSGRAAVAIGLVLPFDLGDAPSSYGKALHYLNNNTASGSVLNNTTLSAILVGQTTLTNTANTYLGAANVDPDGSLGGSASADADDNDNNDDEDGITFPPTGIKINQTGNYTVSIKAVNKNAAKAATIYGWIDFNGDGIFSSSELATTTVAANKTTSQNYTLTYNLDNYKYAANTFRSGTTYARFRITTDALTNGNGSSQIDQRSYGATTDGEVEDYALTINPMSVSGTVNIDKNGVTNNAVDGTPKGTIDGTQLYVYLTSGGTIVSKATVTANNGKYTLSGVNPSSSYSVLLSTDGTKNAGDAASSVLTTLTGTWAHAGVEYGTNNSSGTGLAASPYNGSIAVSTGAGNSDITAVDFGVEKLPTSNSFNYTIAKPAYNSSKILNAANGLAQLAGTDPEDGTLGSGKTIIILSLANMNGNWLVYSGNKLSDGSIITNYNPALLSVRFLGNHSTSAGFAYSFLDAANLFALVPGTYTISWASAILPLDLLNFTVKQNNDKVLISWTTANEVNVQSFDVQYSADGSHWATLQTVPSSNKGGDVYTTQTAKPFATNNYYRLKMNDIDGDYKYSPVKVLKYSSDMIVSFYPNPVRDILHIVSSTGETVKRVTIYDLQGNTILQVNSNNNSVDLRNVTAGEYVVRVEYDSGNVATQKVIKL
ncbi:CshA/CshB family fibrillar adhesin-related protein [Pinibacter aurantiacus]|uniref:T9SS type A sorting domain-containing protein n=1 Tax=Pinibacter aurantiacus TaxID=2851599 RepID=A0A9E2W311_9BACT|nr:CshA/CshB family fibrillar adhesin-related protein [Pinibacter aurantiacus]MBV4355713.1 T9SS type A sorting domain-containing protein [Pinibacter aurantiacus]